jgi:autotransporter family porin
VRLKTRVFSAIAGVVLAFGSVATVTATSAHAATNFYYFQPQYNQGYHIHDAGAGVNLTLLNTTPDNSDAWSITTDPNSGYASQGFSELVNESTGRCMDDVNGPSGTHVISHVCNGGAAQAVKAVPDGLQGQAWQFQSGLRLDNGSVTVRVWTPNSTQAQAWHEALQSSSPPPTSQYFGLGASVTNVAANGSDGVYPLSDSTCASQVQQFAERVPENTTANNDVPPAGTNFSWGPWASGDVGPGGIPETQFNLNHVTGAVPANFTTDEILEWAACKWGMDQNIAKGEAVAESNWKQSNAGDMDSCGQFDSWGILQVRATNPSDCSTTGVKNSGWGGYPWTHNSTAVDADAQMARLRAVYDGQSYMGAGGNGSPALTGGTSTAVGAPIWNAVSTWQSGSNTGTDPYVTGIQDCINGTGGKPVQCWTNTNFVS